MKTCEDEIEDIEQGLEKFGRAESYARFAQVRVLLLISKILYRIWQDGVKKI